MKKNKIEILPDEDGEIEVLKINFSFAVSADEEYYGFTELRGDIFRFSTGTDEPVLIGKLHAYKFNRAQVGDIHFPLDFESETAEFMPMFDENGTEFTDEVLTAARADGFFEDFLILNRLEILPPFRGKNYSAEIFEIIGNTIGFGTVAAMKSFPLQLENRGADGVSQSEGFFGADWQQQMQLDRLPRDEKKAKRRLSNYYKKFGFRKIKNLDADFLVRSY